MKLNWQLYVLIVPPIAWFLVFQYLPLYGIQLAFKDFIAVEGIWRSPWVGMENFERFFRSYNFWTLIRNTLEVSLYQLVLGFPAPILLALMLNEVVIVKFKKTVQMVAYAPHFISTVVIVGMLGVFLSQETGLLNIALEKLGLDQIAFLSSPSWFKTLFVTSGVWQGVGWSSIIYLAALSGVDTQLHEAAIVDGASKIQRIWHINIPGILPTIIILLILEIGGLMSIGFEKIFLMQNALNLSSSDVISTYVYRIGLLGADFSFATAVGLFNSIINCLLLLYVNAYSRRLTKTSLW
ncbi:ABC transporter permease subunit [Paenibacillus sp. PL2-23]|uniref:ABC transporter permease n=1 Tax=Paenibacillus sp. PL2-23 TaxID=2100729 RepID=UPI0030FA378B